MALGAAFENLIFNKNADHPGSVMALVNYIVLKLTAINLTLTAGSSPDLPLLREWSAN